jgi:hypothetical protein
VLHDTCWGARPSFQTFELLIQASPELLFVSDMRNVCPLDYVRKDHYMFWLDFLERVADTYWPSRLPQQHQSAAEFEFGPPGSRPIASPPNALPPSLARIVAGGSMSIANVLAMLQDNDDSSSCCSFDDDDDQTNFSSDSME